MTKLVVLVGPPASGKTTYAKELQGTGFFRVNRDSLRLMLYGERYNKEKERSVKLAKVTLIRSLLASGCNVVSDDTNLHKGDVSTLRHFCLDMRFSFEVVDSFCSVDIDTLLDRDIKRDAKVGREVIEKFVTLAEEYLREKHEGREWTDDREE